MKFRTKSGTVYVLDGIKRNEHGGFTGGLLRLGDKPFRDVSGGSVDMNDQDRGFVTFSELPTVGECFYYFHDRWAGCISTPVEEILEEGSGV